MKKKITVLGAGSWGTALSAVLHENQQEVSLWSHRKEQVEEINQQHTNKKYLPKFAIPNGIIAYSDLEHSIAGADVILFVVPTKAIRGLAKQVANYLTQPVIIAHASKGLEQDSHKRISEILEEEIPEEVCQSLVVLSGPSHAEEVTVKDITTLTAASADIDAAETIQNLFMNDYFRVYTTQDVAGVELGAALKNIIAVGAGALHGLGYGDNAKAALMTRGLAEISRLGVAFGADPITFLGLSGVGDLIVTCTSVHSRNWRAGNLLGQGKGLTEVLDSMGMIVEGISTTKAAYELAVRKEIEMPITAAIYEVLYNKADVKDVIDNLMRRDRKSELS